MRFSFYGHMVCFLNCHLAAHMGNALQRVDELEYILETQEFDMFDTPHVLDHKSAQRWCYYTDVVCRSHCNIIATSFSSRVVFCLGDLNFRIQDHGLHFLRSSINGGRFNLLWSKDQVGIQKNPDLVLKGTVHPCWPKKIFWSMLSQSIFKGRIGSPVKQCFCAILRWNIIIES